MYKSVKEDSVCRICMEDHSSGYLISPCRCSGSLSLIHEDCLKSWLVSKTRDIIESRCEICQTKFSMSVEVIKKCDPMSEGIPYCLFFLLLAAVMVILFIVVCVLSNRQIRHPSSPKEKGLAIGLITVCVVSFITILILLKNSLKDACFTYEVENWSIYNFAEDNIGINTTEAKNVSEHSDDLSNQTSSLVLTRSCP